jgi:radical SAM superfamily enzyme YgiQ (UPF0313 family)
MGYKIVLTTDRTMASDYHGSLFFGFSACLPKGTLPDWFFYPVFCPNGKANKDGSLMFANCGTRKIESALLKSGFTKKEIILAHPEYINNLITKETKILSISANDPLGIGPATSTFTKIFGGEGRMKLKLFELLNSKSIKDYKPKIFLGGPGAWQLKANPLMMKKMGIDCVIVGEGEISAPELFKKTINNEEIQEIVDGIPLNNDTFFEVNGPTIVGLIEATRGCARSCKFCVPTLRKIRSTPLSILKNEVNINLKAGQKGVILHGEDILLYQSDGLDVNSDAVIRLFREIYNISGVKWVSASHASLSSVASSPHTIEKISKILELGTELHPTKSFQVGIETGSPKLIKTHMKGKAYPFKSDEWPDVVKEGFKILTNNHIVPCSTIILGLPGETETDVWKTINLAKLLKPYPSIIVPIFFTPMQSTKLENEKSFNKEDLTPSHWELMLAAWEHNFNWFPKLYKNYGRENPFYIKSIINLIIKVGKIYLLKKIKQKLQESQKNL